MEHPWRPLYASIKNMLQNMPVLQTWEARRFQRPGSLRRLIPSTLHEGEPLFRDLADEIYLAPEYGEGNSDALNDLGVGIISWADLLNRLRADLSRTDSLYKTRPASDSWHTSCASLLVRLFQSQELNAMQQQVKRLAVIPLREGASWTGAPGVNAGGINRIYFPTTDGIYIPGDIGLHLVEKVAASMNQRRALFEAMGVEECPQEVVFAAIEATHTRANTRITLLPHFRYLFKFHPQPESVRAWIKVPTEAVFYQPTSAPLYFPSDGEYDTQNLLPEHFRTSLNNTALFIQASLVNADRPTVPAQNLTWIEWLERATGARYHPPLVQAKGNSAFELSHVMNAVLEHRPEKFVGTLREHWTEYRPDAHHIMPQLRECEVPCETGTTVPIQATYLPTTEIRSELRRLNAEHGFPLLKLPCPLDNSNHNEWRFLEELGVHSSTDMEFYKLVLENMIERVGMTMERVIVVYKCMAQLASAQHEEDLRYEGSCKPNVTVD